MLSGCDALVGAHEAPERLQLEAAVGVGHIGPGQAIHAWRSREVPDGDLRQQAVVGAREMVSDLADLFVHDVEVVEEPLFGQRDLALRADRRDDVVVSSQQHAPVLAHPGQEIPSLAGPRADSLGRGQALGVLLQALDAEQLGADRLLALRRSGDPDGGSAHLRSRSAGGKIPSSCGLMKRACGSGGTPGT